MKEASTPEIAVVILNYNGKSWLQKFLPSVIENTDKNLAEIWVADNASQDDSLEFIKNEFPTIKTIALDENHGFAEGYNQAIAQIHVPYILLLNSDVQVTPNWLEPLHQTLKNDSNIAACQPKLLDYNRPDYFEYAGAAGGFMDKYGYPFCRGRIFDHIEKDTGQYNDEIEVFWATGACMLIKRELFELAGGFDKDFFAHMEEIDLCWRFKNLGYQIKYIPTSTVYHVGGGTLQAQNPRKTFLNFRNNRLLLVKNLPAKNLFKVNFIRNILDFQALVLELVKMNFKNAQAILQAHFAYRKLRKQAESKKEQFAQIQEQHRIDKPNLQGQYAHSIVYAYFIQSKKKFSQLIKI